MEWYIYLPFGKRKPFLCLCMMAKLTATYSFSSPQGKELVSVVDSYQREG